MTEPNIIVRNHAKNEWIARSIWGNGRDTDKPTFTNQDEAVQAFFQLLAPPRIDTDTEWLNNVENTFIPAPWEKTNRSTEISLPNWRPDESYYSIKQSRSSLYHPAQRFSNRPAEIKDGAKELKVELDGKVGKLQFESHNDGTIEETRTRGQVLQSHINAWFGGAGPTGRCSTILTTDCVSSWPSARQAVDQFRHSPHQAGDYRASCRGTGSESSGDSEGRFWASAVSTLDLSDCCPGPAGRPPGRHAIVAYVDRAGRPLF